MTTSRRSTIFENSFQLTISASKIPKSDVFGYCDPYFKVFVNGIDKYTSDIKKGKAATWNPFIVGFFTRLCKL